jgi:hypothetical protein
MNDATNISLLAAKSFAKNFVKDTAKWAQDISKPIYLEEFGMARDNFENLFKEYPYLSSAHTTHKDDYFTVCFQQAAPAHFAALRSLLTLMADNHRRRYERLQSGRRIRWDESMGIWWNLAAGDAADE